MKKCVKKLKMSADLADLRPPSHEATADLRDFWWKFGLAGANEVKKCAQTYVKKRKMRANARKVT